MIYFLTTFISNGEILFLILYWRYNKITNDRLQRILFKLIPCYLSPDENCEKANFIVVFLKLIHSFYSENTYLL